MLHSPSPMKLSNSVITSLCLDIIRCQSPLVTSEDKSPKLTSRASGGHDRPVSSLSHRRQSLYIESSECTFLTQNIASPLCTHRHCCQNCTVCSGLDCTQAWVDNLLNFGQTQENLGFWMAKPVKIQPKSGLLVTHKSLMSAPIPIGDWALG